MTNADFSKRERQVMDAIYRLENGTAEELLSEIPDPPTNSAIRSTLRILVDKEHLERQQEGRRYVYRPVARGVRVRSSALRRVVDTFFAGSTSRAVSALLRDRSASLTEDEADQLQDLIDRARGEGR